MASGNVKKMIFVRQRTTLQFVNTEGKWVVSLDEAARFRSTWEACAFCLKKSVQSADIVMRLGEPRYDVTIHLR